MPELPEVETTVKGVNEKVRSRIIKGVWTDTTKLVKRPASFDLFKKEISGKKVKYAWRRAKNVIIDLSDGYSLLIHQKMTGHLLYGSWEEKGGRWISKEQGPMDDPYNRFIRIIFFLDNGKMLALSDLRKFAKIELWKTNELVNSENFKNLGPEPLEKDFDFKKFKTALSGRRGKVKQVLMKPEVIAGIGNIYSDEALWRAKINPLRETSELGEKELKSLYNAVIYVLKRGVDLRGESFSDYRDIEGKKGDFDDERKAYHREGENCSRCGTAIKRVKINARSAHFCPVCQKI